MPNNFKETNFEAIDKDGAKKLIENLPEFEPTVDIEETDYQLGDMMFSEDGKEVVPVEKKVRLPAVKGNNLDEDFDASRQNLRELSERQAEIIDSLFKLCKSSDSPRAYEVLGQMIDRFVVLEEKMIELYVKKAKAEKETAEDGTTQVAKNITNNQYNLQMSTKELLDELSKEDGETDNDD